VQREERVGALRDAKRRQDEDVASLEDFIRRFRYNANKASLVQSRIKQLEKIERIVLPPERKRIRFHFPEPPKSGRIVMELQGLSKAYGPKVVLDRVDLAVEKGEKIALVGHNGAGKSTLMKVLAGGDFQTGSCTPGHNVVMDYFAQDQAEALDGTRTAYEELYADCPYDLVPRLRDLLGTFLFSGDDIHKKVAVLSGGERNRLALAKMLLKSSNLLLMDEPTNHLDLFSKEVLLDALREFPGTVVFVSHDRHFIDGLATRVVEVEDGRLASYPGDYEYYLAKKAGLSIPSTGMQPHAQPSPVPDPRSQVPESKEDRLRQREADKQRQKDDRQRQKQLAGIEAAIEAAETELASLEDQMNQPGFFDDQERAAAAGRSHEELTARIQALYSDWETLQG
ncbi:MAG TPA: ATP-binding cassette domain-containing protein, partial [Desulfurivibrionaceae bacterium]|nr:ATP-binding cassette domain-containing protein [Desulfurivibrionaceae bacterium]